MFLILLMYIINHPYVYVHIIYEYILTFLNTYLKLEYVHHTKGIIVCYLFYNLPFSQFASVPTFLIYSLWKVLIPFSPLVIACWLQSTNDHTLWVYVFLSFSQ